MLRRAQQRGHPRVIAPRQRRQDRLGPREEQRHGRAQIGRTVERRAVHVPLGLGEEARLAHLERVALGARARHRLPQRQLRAVRLRLRRRLHVRRAPRRLGGERAPRRLELGRGGAQCPELGVLPLDRRLSGGERLPRAAQLRLQLAPRAHGARGRRGRLRRLRLRRGQPRERALRSVSLGGERALGRGEPLPDSCERGRGGHGRELGRGHAGGRAPGHAMVRAAAALRVGAVPVRLGRALGGGGGAILPLLVHADGMDECGRLRDRRLRRVPPQHLAPPHLALLGELRGLRLEHRLEGRGLRLRGAELERHLLELELHARGGGASHLGPGSEAERAPGVSAQTRHAARSAARALLGRAALRLRLGLRRRLARSRLQLGVQPRQLVEQRGEHGRVCGQRAARRLAPPERVDRQLVALRNLEQISRCLRDVPAQRAAPGRLGARRAGVRAHGRAARGHGRLGRRPRREPRRRRAVAVVAHRWLGRRVRRRRGEQ